MAAGDVPIQRSGAGLKRRGAEKVLTARERAQPLRLVAAESRQRLPKPDWIRVRLPVSKAVSRVKGILRRHQLATVCEEAQCPNIAECFGKGTATFMILGDICTRRCAFCDVASGIPLAPDPQEPEHLARAIAEMQLDYVVITSVDRDDLPDGGAAHFVACIRAVRTHCPQTRIEVLTPDFRNRLAEALPVLAEVPADVFNHNLETVPSLYRKVRPGANYRHSLSLLAAHLEAVPGVPTKSGLMLGLGERLEQVLEVMRDLRHHGVSMLTLGQYLQPSVHHLAVQRYVPPSEFDRLQVEGMEMGFSHVASGPLVRSSYHADLQAAGRDAQAGSGTV